MGIAFGSMTRAIDTTSRTGKLIMGILAPIANIRGERQQEGMTGERRWDEIRSQAAPDSGVVMKITRYSLLLIRGNLPTARLPD